MIDFSNANRQINIWPKAFKDWRVKILDSAPVIVACTILTVIVLIYGRYQTGVFSVDEINLTTSATMTLILAATGQTIVLIRGGIDLSVGGMINLSTVIAATQFGNGPLDVAFWSAIILMLGLLVGALNGLLMSTLNLQPFLVTLATWSMLNGVAMMILATDGGSVPAWWVGLGYSEFLGLAMPVWLLLTLIVFWQWFRSTGIGIMIKASGSDEKSSRLSGVSILKVNLVAYGLSGLFAAGAGLYLTTQIGVGSPTIGKDYILPSVAAAVIGGVSMFGGRGHLAGTIVGALILGLITNLVFVLRVSSFWQPVAAGTVLLFAVLAGSFAERAKRGLNK